MSIDYSKLITQDKILPNFAPFSNFKNSLWIKLVPYKIIEQSTENRAGSIKLFKDPKLGSITLLSQNEIQLTNSHDWENYEHMGTRAAEALSKFKYLTKDMKSASKLFTDTKKTLESGKESFSANVEQTLSNISKQASHSMTPTKIDTPLIYKNTPRREYNFTFLLAANSSTYEEVFQPVYHIQYLSAPESIPNSAISVNYPYIWRITSQPNADIINMQYAACTSIQPSFIGPFINGYPIKCELTVSFKDLTPLYKSTIASGAFSGYKGNITHENPNT